jgi:hypothetical protein
MPDGVRSSRSILGDKPDVFEEEEKEGGESFSPWGVKLGFGRSRGAVMGSAFLCPPVTIMLRTEHESFLSTRN